MNGTEFMEVWNRKIIVFWPRLAETKEGGDAFFQAWYGRLQWYCVNALEDCLQAMYAFHGNCLRSSDLSPKLNSLVCWLEDKNAARDQNKPAKFVARLLSEAEEMANSLKKYTLNPGGQPPFFFSDRREVWIDVRTGEEIAGPWTADSPLRWTGRMAELMAAHQKAREVVKIERKRSAKAKTPPGG